MAQNTVTVKMSGHGYKMAYQESVRRANLVAKGKLVVELTEGWNEEHAELAIKMAGHLYAGHKLVLKVGRKTTVVKKGVSVEGVRKDLKL